MSSSLETEAFIAQKRYCSLRQPLRLLRTTECITQAWHYNTGRNAESRSMHIPRFFLTRKDVRLLGDVDRGEPANVPLDLFPGDRLAIVENATVSQVRNVLRLRAGDRILILNNAGLIFTCSIESLDGKQISCAVENRAQAEGDPSVCVRLALPLLKGDRFEWALQKLTEVGVSSIVPIATARSVVKFDAADAKGAQNKLTRWMSILREAAEQCERATIPHIVPPKKIEDFIDSLTDGGTQEFAFVCAERSSVVSLKDIFLGCVEDQSDLLGTTDGTINLLVGPEGGFTPDEIEYAVKRGVKPVSLGRRILRAETAAIISVAQVIWAVEK